MTQTFFVRKHGKLASGSSTNQTTCPSKATKCDKPDKSLASSTNDACTTATRALNEKHICVGYGLGLCHGRELVWFEDGIIQIVRVRLRVPVL